MSHTFHIPVLGLAYSVDTPIKVARYGISSVVSIVDDILIERMRQLYTEKNNEELFLSILRKLISAVKESRHTSISLKGSSINSLKHCAVKHLQRVLTLQDTLIFCRKALR